MASKAGFNETRSGRRSETDQMMSRAVSTRLSVPGLRLAERLLRPDPFGDVAGHDQAQRRGLGVDPADADVHRDRFAGLRD